MSRIVLDTNSLIQSIPPRSKYHKVWESFLDGTNELCVSNSILDEYEEIIIRLAGEEVAKLIVELILNNPNTILVTPHYKFNLILADPDDNMFVDCAIAAGARLIVTDDKHFNILKQYTFPVVETMRLEDFYICLKGQS